MTPAQKRLSEGYCRVCPTKRSPRSSVYCPKHLEQAMRSSYAKAAAEKGKREHWKWTSEADKLAMKSMRAAGHSLAKVAKAFGVSVATVFTWTSKKES